MINETLCITEHLMYNYWSFKFSCYFASIRFIFISIILFRISGKLISKFMNYPDFHLRPKYILLSLTTSLAKQDNNIVLLARAEKTGLHFKIIPCTFIKQDSIIDWPTMVEWVSKRKYSYLKSWEEINILIMI